MKKQACIFLAVFSMSTYSQVWAFDCTKAFLPIDFVICSSQQVMQANEIHEKAWFASRARLDITQKKALLDDQRKWLKRYPPQCGIPAKGKPLETISHDIQQCVIAELSSRTEFLQNFPYSSDSSIQSFQPIDKSENTELKERVTTEDPVVRDDIFYLPNEDKPFTGRYETYYPNGNKKGVAHIKEGKFDGLMTLWDENGQNKTEKNIKNGIEMPVVDEGTVNGNTNASASAAYSSELSIKQKKELTVFFGRAAGKQAKVEDIVNVMPQNKVQEMVQAGLNLNGFLCAKIVHILPLELSGKYEVACIAYGGGEAQKTYIIDALNGTAFEP